MSDSKQLQVIPTGPERELQIYAQALAGGKPVVPVPLELLEQKAKEILAPRAYDNVASGTFIMVTGHLCWGKGWRIISAIGFSAGCWPSRRKRIRWRRFSFGAACFRIPL